MPEFDPLSVTAALLDWYDRHARRLPWRVPPGAAHKPDPYRVWLSEIMLQQTTVKAVAPYFERFTQIWPTVEAMAHSPLEHVLKEWAGLGYYARARNLHACAVVVTDEFDGRFPDTEQGLRALPGVGAYTAAAIAAIAFGRPANVVDGNIERVMARLFDEQTPLPKAKTVLKAHAAPFVPKHRPGDYAQALMDLGATICTPKNPACALCPITQACLARANGTQAERPVRAPKTQKPTRTGRAYWLRDHKGRVLLRRRADKGMLGAMVEVPSSGWSGGEDTSPKPPVAGLKWKPLKAQVTHTFTHFHLTLEVVAARLDRAPRVADGFWVSEDELADQGLPSVMKKVVRIALSEGW